MKRMAMFIAGIFLLGLPSTLISAKELTLDDCIELALRNRASIIEARGLEKQAAAGKWSALGAFLPQVRASYSYSKGKETRIDPPNKSVAAQEYIRDTVIIPDTLAGTLDTFVVLGQVPSEYITSDEQDIGPSKRWYVGAEMTVLDFSNWFDYAAARAQHARSRLDVLASEQDLIYSVKTVYYAYLATVENVAVQEEAVKRADEQLKLIQSRFDLGSASISDVLKQKVQYGEDRLGLMRAKNAVIKARADLAYTIGLDPREDQQFATDYRMRVYEGLLDNAIEFGLGHNPRLLAREKGVTQAINTARAAKSTYLPTLSLYADYSRFNGTQAFPVSFDYSSDRKSCGFTISYNIFDGFYREKRLTDARVYRNNAKALYADTRNMTVSKIKTAYLEIEQLKEQKLVSEENLAAATEDLRITQEKYNLGAAAILDLLDAQVSVKSAQVALISVEFDLNLAVAQLENAMGKM